MVPLCEITRKWLDTPHVKISCIAFVHDFLEEALGVEIPDEWGDLTIANHHAEWVKDPAAVEHKMCEAVKAYTIESNPKYPKLLDLLVVEIKDHGLIPAVYIGGGNAIASFIEGGVQVFNLDKNNKPILAGSF